MLGGRCDDSDFILRTLHRLPLLVLSIEHLKPRLVYSVTGSKNRFGEDRKRGSSIEVFGITLLLHYSEGLENFLHSSFLVGVIK